MSAAHETPDYHGLLAALTKLSPSKVERFAIALGVPQRVVEESRINNPRDICRVKADALSWWFANVEVRSWEVIAKALVEVDERNMARSLKSRGPDLVLPGKSYRY